MISFACQRIDMKDIIMCSFELAKTEYELLVFLMQEEEALTVNAIADQKGLERSTVQKAISKLRAKDLIERRQINLRSGGYRFIYAVHDKDALKRRLQGIVDTWHRSVNEAINGW